MKKEDIVSLFVYVAMVAIAVILGFTVLRDLIGKLDANHVPFNNNLLFASLAVILGIIFNAYLIEFGHLIGAKVGGYSIVSFNVLWLCWHKYHGKWKFGLKGYDGLTGETKIKPKKEKTSPMWYVWFPIILYFVELIAVAVLLAILNREVEGGETLMTDYGWIGITGFIFATIGGLINLYNYIPVKLDAMNDGYRLVLIQKPINKKAFDIMLTLEAKEIEGEDVTLPEPFDEITNYTAEINLKIIYSYLKDKEYQKAIDLLELTSKDTSKIGDSTLQSLEGLKVFTKCLTLSSEEFVKYYNELDLQNKKIISSCRDIETSLAYLYVSVLVEKSRYEVDFAISKYNKNYKKVSKKRQEIVEELFNNALKSLKESSPDLFKEE